MTCSPVQLRRARSLVLEFDGGAVSGFNFLSRQNAVLNPLSIAILVSLTEWTPPAMVLERLVGAWPRRVIADTLLSLLHEGMVIVQNTAAAGNDSRYEREWQWGATAGYYHFGIRDPVYLPLDSVGALLAERASADPVVQLVFTNEGFKQVIPLPFVELEGGVSEVMRARRSWRGFDCERSITVDQLASCLFSGLGITGFVKQSIPRQPPLPLKMTPSGGGRNPYEGYVYALRVDGVAPGMYHYSGTEHSLGLVSADRLPTVGTVLAGQPWFDGAAALLLLVANFTRTMWKYPHPTGFRVVLLEAGHIAQNVLLAATAQNLAAAPTCAISDSIAAGILGLDPVTQSAIYAVALGPRSPIPTEADVEPVLSERAPHSTSRRGG